MNYDLNLPFSGKGAMHTVELVFANGEYRFEKTVNIGGNCTGFIVIEAAVETAYRQLSSLSDGLGSKLPGMVMIRPGDGAKLRSLDDMEHGASWLMDQLISAKIVALSV